MDKKIDDATFQKSPVHAPCMVMATLALQNLLAKKWCVRCAGRLELHGPKHAVRCVDCHTAEWRIPETPLPFLWVHQVRPDAETVYHRALWFDDGGLRHTGPWMRSEGAALRRLAPTLAGTPWARAGLVTYDRMHVADQTVPRDYVRATWRVGPPVVGPWMHTADRAFAQVLARVDGPQLVPLVQLRGTLAADDPCLSSI